MTLCGISSRFQLLSPSERQVAHVLLTRPPLIREQALFTVRLACVRRAASVRPEPGSNSLKFVSNREFNSRSNLYSNKQTQRYLNAICLSEIIVFSSVSQTVCPRNQNRQGHNSFFILFNFQGTGVTRLIAFL